VSANTSKEKKKSNLQMSRKSLLSKPVRKMQYAAIIVMRKKQTLSFFR